MNIKISIEHERRQIPVASKLVCHSLALVGETPSNKMELAIVELLTNIITYSDVNRKDSLIDMQCRFDGTEFVVIVSDDGERLPSSVAQQYADNDVSMPRLNIGGEGLSISDLPESGWGIQLIKSACESVSYKRVSAQNVYTLTFDLSAVTA